MNQVTRNIISILLATLIILINLAELAVTIDHFEHHAIENTSHITLDHGDCGSICSHIHKTNKHHLCDGHYLNFMPQLVVNLNNFETQKLTELSLGQSIFMRVKQYSSSYTHLFTSRPPPSMA